MEQFYVFRFFFIELDYAGQHVAVYQRLKQVPVKLLGRVYPSGQGLVMQKFFPKTFVRRAIVREIQRELEPHCGDNYLLYGLKLFCTILDRH